MNDPGAPERAHRSAGPGGSHATWAGAAPVRAAVVGAGLMGAGIGQLAAQSGIPVSLVDISGRALERGLEQIRVSLCRIELAGALTESPETVLGRIEPTLDLKEGIRAAPLVIEAVPEVLPVKLELFAELDRAAPEGSILATNTSQFSVTEIAAATQRPQDVVGLHFFNPVPVMPLVEVIPGLATAPSVLERALSFCRSVGRHTVVAKDVQGFIASRANLALQLECQRILEEGVAEAEDIDSTFRLGFGHPMGPLELADYVGLDTLLRIAEAMEVAYGDRFRPPQVLRRLVAAGHHGRKSGRGFHDYSDADREVRG